MIHSNRLFYVLPALGLLLSACEQQYKIASAPTDSPDQNLSQAEPLSGGPVIEPIPDGEQIAPSNDNPSSEPGAVPSGDVSPSPEPSPLMPTPTPSSSSSPSPSPYVIPDAVPGVNAGCMPVPAVLLAFSGADVSLSGGATVGGNAYLFKNTSLSIAGTSRITGSAFVDFASTAVSGTRASLSQVDLELESLVVNYAIALAGLEPTETSEAITSSKTILGNGRLNVINVNGDIALKSSDSLILDGSASDVFVINVHGGIGLNGQASIRPAGGVVAKNIIFNSLGAGASLALNGGGVITGTFVGLNRGAELSGTGVFRGSLYVRGLGASGGGQLWDPVVFCSSK